MNKSGDLIPLSKTTKLPSRQNDNILTTPLVLVILTKTSLAQRHVTDITLRPCFSNLSLRDIALRPHISTKITAYSSLPA